MKIRELNSYECIEERYIDDIKSTSYVLRHKKSGARLALLSNEDENKVFSIAFRTPPEDSTGLPHILEHSVLCGSRDFPVKDPFVELVKGSLNTFLNAMTYPDKTVYPVASCNDKDFQNLMHVYMDAVFYPNIYKYEEIFCQEGWHYEMQTEESELKINGVVYNEMKGAFSSPEGVLEREVLNSLYPDTAYSFESGGDPKVIPTLSYEQFLDFHKKYYHPSNSYIYLYGNMDMVEKLQWLDEQYLSTFEKIELDSSIGLQQPFSEVRELHRQYPITEEESTNENTYLAFSKVVAETTDRKLNVAFQVLDYALLSAPGAPIRQALLDAGIGKDIMGFYEEDIRQTYFSVVSKGANESDKERFVETILDTLKRVAAEGVNEKAIEAAINSMEFKFREADFGNYPKGLMYGLSMLGSWLYKDDEPFAMLELLDTYEQLRQLNGTGYYEQLITKCLIDNQHGTCLILEPKQGLTAQQDQKLAAKLADYKASLTEEQIKTIVRQTADLKVYQEEPSSDEDLRKIPLLQVSDIRKDIVPLVNEERTCGDTKVLFHKVETNGIAYLNLLFDSTRIPQELLPYASVLKSVLSYVDTKQHSFADLSNEINRNCGGISFGMKYFRNLNGTDHAFFMIKTKALYQQLPFVFEILKEILTSSNLEDEKRLHEIISEVTSKLQMQMQASGHSAAVTRAMAYFSPASAYAEAIDGISFYQFMKDLEEHYEERKEDLKKGLAQVMQVVFAKELFMVDLTATEEGYEAFAAELDAFRTILKTETAEKAAYQLVLSSRNEGFKTASQVQYVAACGNFAEKGYTYTGALKVLKNILSYEYLWNQVRVQGGAYGCMNNFARQGDSYFVSYRDPQLERTMQVYEKAADFIENSQFDERSMTKFIIGAVSDMDVPLTPSSAGNRSFLAFMQGITDSMLQKERDEVLAVDLAEVHRLSNYIRAFLTDHQICVIGGEEKIEANKSLFKTVLTL